MKYIAIDIGNTRVKAARSNKRVSLASNSSENELAAALQGLCGPYDECVVGLSSVSPKLSKVIKRILRSAKVIDVHDLLLSPASPLKKVKSSGTGSDRLLGAIAALSLLPAPLITIDCGTATTINLVNKRSEFCGGLILPGVQTQLDALHGATAALPKLHAEGAHPVVGRTTEHAIRSGVIRGSVGAIVHCVREIQQTTDGKDARVVLSGGNAEYLLRGLRKHIELLHSKDLVLRGILQLLERTNKDVYGSHSPTRRSGG